MKVALRLRSSGKHVIGVVAASATFALRDFCFRIAHELGELCAAPIAVICALDGNSPHATNAAAQKSPPPPLEWVHLVPVASSFGMAREDDLAPVIGYAASEHPFVLVDLQALHLDPDAAAQVDGVVIVTVAHAAREGHLLKLRSVIPKGRLVGVVIVSASAR